MFQLPKRRNTNGRPNGSDGSGSSGGGSSTPTTTISSSEYARRCRALMALDRDLRALGAGRFFDLPSITVIGGQSAGKSSLVDAVSGITVPRDSGTCTRCPMECSMSSSADSWSCKIFLRFDYNSLGTKLPETTASTVAFGSTITDKRTVELWLRRAQAAILSPHIPHQNFYIKTENDLRNPPADDQRLAFSKNTVVVDLSDPKITGQCTIRSASCAMALNNLSTDLSFVDLPGLIQNDRPEAIEVVRDLTISRINLENTLILVTMPMSDDLQNQQAARLAEEADPTGERTIAVLTKPDVLGAGASGSRKKWKDTLEGREKPLTHGYHCVRLPDDDERSRGISSAESERRSAEYFDSTPPWKDVTDRSCFGVANLTSFLSELLVARIETNLPTLKKNLEALLQQTNEELQNLPPIPTCEPAAEVLLRTTAFCKAFHAAGLSQSNRRLYLQFKADIRSTSPDFRPFTRGNYIDPRSQISSQRTVCRHGWELPNHVPFRATTTLVLRFTSEWKTPSVNCFNSVVDAAWRITRSNSCLHISANSASLETYIRYCTPELEACQDQALGSLEKMLAFEKLPLFTQNTHHFLTEKKTWLRSVDFADELGLMANVRAYWQIAYQRIIDYVPLLVEHEFSQRLANRLQEMLFENLLRGPDASAKMRELLTEDPTISAKRALLQSRKDRLLVIKEKLDGLS
ncbi:P-loop containing nucleoside triphosphate hydrolase protein [Mycena filopes]|nr:P-loop containing nucleoside triphosphate hydrolase protein [Mycena filopes]